LIRSFRHKLVLRPRKARTGGALKRLFEADDPRGLPSADVRKLRAILLLLGAADTPKDVELPGLRLHALKGDLKGFWAVTVRANWRIVFRFEGGDAFDVDYVDYH
jgi:proteic killer suppression protein